MVFFPLFYDLEAVFFQDLFNRELRKIWDNRRTHLRFRADFYAGTPAEYVVTQPSGPTTDFMEQLFDPTRYLGLWDVTDELRKVQLEIKTIDLNWDYLFNYKSYQAGLGAVD